MKTKNTQEESWLHSIFFRIKSKALLFMLTFFSCLTGWSQITGDLSACQSSSHSYTVPQISGQNYVWTVSGGAIVSPSATANEVDVRWDEVGTGTLTLVSEPGSTTETLDVTVTASPNPFIIPVTNLFCSGGAFYLDLKDRLENTNIGRPCAVACEGSSVVYATELVAGASYTWNVSGEANYTVNNNEITVVWGEVGIGQVSVTQNSANGCSTVAEMCVEILNAPEANFSTLPEALGNVLTICQGQTVYFNDLSIDGTQWAWDFGDDFVSSNQNPAHTYLLPGTYTVTLTVSNFGVGEVFYFPEIRPDNGGPVLEENNNPHRPIRIIHDGNGGPIEQQIYQPESSFTCDCKDTYTLTVIVEELPAPIIECVSTVCAMDTVTYSTPAACTNFTWTASGGTILATNNNEVTVVWGDGSTGPGYLTLDVGDCPGYCARPAVVRIPIIPIAAQISGPDVVCVLSVHRYSIPQVAGMTYNWSVDKGVIIAGDGTHEVTVFWNEGEPKTYGISVTYGNDLLGCGGSSTLVVEGVPELLIKTPEVICENTTVPLNEIRTNRTGDFNLAASNWSIITPSGTLLENYALNTSSLTTYNFNAGPGTYVIIAKPASGLYCNDEARASIKVVARPVAPSGITGDVSVCPNTTHTYNVLGTLTNPVYEWTVVNGTTTYTQEGSSISVAWGNDLPYSLSVTQRDVSFEACNSAPFVLDVQSKYPIEMPTISGDALVCLGGVSDYSISSLNPDATYQWSVSDLLGNIITPSNTLGVTVSWLTNNQQNTTANVELAVTVCGITESVSYHVDLEGFIPTFTHSEPTCVDSPISFTGPVGATYSEWSFGDGATSTEANPSHIFDTDGSYPVSLFVTNATGCSAEIAEVIDVNPLPIANISSPDRLHYAEESCGVDPIQVNLFAVQNTAGTYTYEWYRSGNPVSLGTSNPILVTETGSYYAVVTDSQTGCSSVSDELLVYLTSCGCDIAAGHTEDFTSQILSPTCNEVAFTPFVTGDIRVHSWTFSDPASGGANYTTDTNPTHAFSKAGYFRVRMNYIGPKNGNNLDSSICYIEKTVFLPIVANFTAVKTCVNNEMTLQLFDQSGFVDNAGIDSYSWVLTGPTTVTSTLANPSFALPGGTYTVELTVTSTQYGVTCSTVKSIVVPTNVQANMSYNSGACPGELTEFTDVSTGDEIVSWLWSFGFAAPSSNVQNPVRILNTPGTYPIILTVQNKYGCTSTTEGTFEVGVPENNPILESGTTNLCQGQTVTFTAPVGSNYIWSNGATTASITVSVVGIYTVSLTGTNGCSYTTSPVSVTVNPKPIPVISGTSQLCAGATIQLSSTTGYNSYAWSFNQDPTNDDVYTTLPQTVSGFSFNSTLASVGDYRVVVTDANGCTGASAPYHVTVYPVPALPFLGVGQAGPYCEGSIYTLSVLNEAQDVTYVWSTGQVGTSIQARDAGAYSLTAYGLGGCKVSSETIVIEEKPDVSDVMTGCYEICRSDFPIVIPGPAGYASYEWYQGSTVVSTSQNLNATEFGVYYLVLTNELGCTATSGDVVITRLPEAQVSLSASIDCCASNTICKGESANLTVNFTGSGPYVFTYTDGGAVFTVTTSSNPYTLVVTPDQTTTYELLSVTSENEPTGCFEVCGSATVAVNICTTVKGKNATTKDCSKNCFDAEITQVTTTDGGCQTVDMTLSCNSTCQSALSNLGISIQCGNIASATNSLGFPIFVNENDPNTGLSGIKVDDISGFCSNGSSQEFVVSYTLCPNDNDCSFTLCEPIVAFKAGECVNYVYASLPTQNKSLKQESGVADIQNEGASVRVYPNPFSEATMIDLELDKTSDVYITMYDMMGKQITVIHNGETAAGQTVYRWNAQMDNGETLPSGVYYITTCINGEVGHIKVLHNK